MWACSTRRSTWARSPVPPTSYHEENHQRGRTQAAPSQGHLKQQPRQQRWQRQGPHLHPVRPHRLRLHRHHLEPVLGCRQGPAGGRRHHHQPVCDRCERGPRDRGRLPRLQGHARRPLLRIGRRRLLSDDARLQQHLRGRRLPPRAHGRASQHQVHRRRHHQQPDDDAAHHDHSLPALLRCHGLLPAPDDRRHQQADAVWQDQGQEGRPGGSQRPLRRRRRHRRGRRRARGGQGFPRQPRQVPGHGCQDPSRRLVGGSPGHRQDLARQGRRRRGRRPLLQHLRL